MVKEYASLDDVVNDLRADPALLAPAHTPSSTDNAKTCRTPGKSVQIPGVDLPREVLDYHRNNISRNRRSPPAVPAKKPSLQAPTKIGSKRCQILDDSACMVCSSCRQAITGRALELKAAAEAPAAPRLYHPGCLVCTVCQRPLETEYFSHNGAYYCANDYKKATAPTCRGCNNLILERDATVAAGNYYHPAHFCCAECGIAIKSMGGKFVSFDGTIKCEKLRLYTHIIKRP